MPTFSAACCGVSATLAASSAGARDRRSAALTAGIPQYIIPMPEANQSRNSTHRVTPTHR